MRAPPEGHLRVAHAPPARLKRFSYAGIFVAQYLLRRERRYKVQVC
jgi:hypothetical protein